MLKEFFGFKPGQTLKEFADEVKGLSDAAIVAEQIATEADGCAALGDDLRALLQPATPPAS